MQDSLPAGGLRLYREGVEPSGPLRKVSGHISLLPSRTCPVASRICSKSYAKELGAVSSVTDQASDGGASDAELLGNGGFAQSFAGEVSDFLRLRGDFGGPAVRTAFFAGLSYARLHPIAQNAALELGEHRQHAGERPPARRRQIEGLAQ